MPQYYHHHYFGWYLLLGTGIMLPISLRVKGTAEVSFLNLGHMAEGDRGEKGTDSVNLVPRELINGNMVNMNMLGT